MRLKINITREILEKSMYCGIDRQTLKKLPNEVANIGRNCGIGEAICDLLPTAWISSFHIWVFDVMPDFNLVQKKLSKISIELPFEAVQFIKIFDILSPEKRLELDPISFEIDIPDSVISKIGLKELENILSTSLTLEKVC